MCGILAAFSVDTAERNLSKSLQTLKHRGPDAHGEWNSSSASVWLGHRRLSIVDISEAGCQPMHNEDNTIWLICNGEIYNYPTLRLHLEKLGHRFYSKSDNEVILHAYETWGDTVIDHLEGMFAFVLWDETQQRVLAVRDRVGMKPLCYVEIGKGLIFASEVSALLSLTEPKPEPEPLALAYMLTLGYIPCPWSIWKGIYKLEPGYVLTWKIDTGIRKRCYWQPPRYIDTDSRDDSEKWPEIFYPVLKEHLLSDVPIGLFLSGGLDSSSIAAGLHDLGQSVQANTVSFPGSSQDEAPIATKTAQYLKLPHRVVPLEVTDVDILLRKVMAAFDEPQGYSALLSMYLLSQETVKNVKVVLAGDGGDEIFGGYPWYQNLDGNFPKRSLWIRRVLRPLTKRNASSEIRQKTAKHFTRISPLHRHAWRLYPRFLPEEAETLLAPLEIQFGDWEMLAPLRKHFEPNLPLKRALQRIDLMNFCADSILAKVDRGSMAHSLEVRIPFLDRRLIEWALTRPLRSHENKENKPVLRNYLRSRVPEVVLKHPKQGFSLRILDAFDWDEAINSIRKGPWVQQGYWASDWKELLQPGVPYVTARIWNLLILTRWAEAWL